jgi:uncharacterized membrane protein YdfJ with MMPL/SSD domain
MLDPLAQQVGIGGAVAIILVATVLKFLPAFMTALKSQNGKNKSGDLSPAEWEARMKQLRDEGTALIEAKMEKLTEDLMKDIRNLMEARTEKLREVMEKTLERWRPPGESDR